METDIDQKRHADTVRIVAADKRCQRLEKELSDLRRENTRLQKRAQIAEERTEAEWGSKRKVTGCLDCPFFDDSSVVPTRRYCLAPNGPARIYRPTQLTEGMSDPACPLREGPIAVVMEGGRHG